MSVADVDRVKTDLKNYLEILTPSVSTFYTLIEKCVDQFWSKHSQSHPTMGGWASYVEWIPFKMGPEEARTIIINKVIPWLLQAKNCVAENREYYGDFVALLGYVESKFAPPASVQPAPPASNPSPSVQPVTTHVSDAVASLQSQVKALQDKINGLELKDFLFFYKSINDLQKVQSENSSKALQDQINVLEFTKMEFNNFYRYNYKIDIKYLTEEIVKLKEAQSRDKASFDSQIATLRAEATSFAGILARVQALENLVATRQQPPAQPPAQPPSKTRPWPFGAEQPTLLDSRPDTHPQVQAEWCLRQLKREADNVI
jgi:hypothetical protein